mmetsp:Transcript_33818/g.74982  ORF Transcript_33818/g.74982 Transcript_33818/m.74982 type:complete len:93 (+) Transcript_33818:477-755(+)
MLTCSRPSTSTQAQLLPWQRHRHQLTRVYDVAVVPIPCGAVHNDTVHDALTTQNNQTLLWPEQFDANAEMQSMPSCLARCLAQEAPNWGFKG